MPPRADGVPIAVEDHYQRTDLQWPRLALTADTIMWLPGLGVAMAGCPCSHDELQQGKRSG
jgi:hypothetical protein